jgi:hypothetical protein
MAQEFDRTFDEHPPEVCVLTLMEQLSPGLEQDLGAALDEGSQLLVAQAIEQAQGTELIGMHQIVAK